MSYPLKVFVSSACFELRDLRAAVRTSLEALGAKAMMSDEAGFPHVPDLPPYASCLQVVEECPLFVGVLERYYGNPFDNWGRYDAYKGLSPTHAEFRHAMAQGKRCLFFVHTDTWAFYEVWRKNGDVALANPPTGLDVRTLELFNEIKQVDPAPWITKYADVSDVVVALRDNLLNEVYASLREREKRNADLASYLASQLLSAAPEIRAEVQGKLDPDLSQRVHVAEQAVAELEAELANVAASSKEAQSRIQEELDRAKDREDALQRERDVAMATLMRAALRDAEWLHRVRTQLMPKQPGRVPFHNGQEVGLRGFRVHRFGTPRLDEVTWSPLDYAESNLHRGYHAGLVFKGAKFAPGITWASRRIGDADSKLWWREPNIYFKDYLEVSTGSDELETPLCDRNREYAVRNPDGKQSEWIRFTYEFDDERLFEELERCEQAGKEHFDGSRFAEAVEPLRRAMVFSKELLGEDHERSQALRELWNRAIDAADLARMRFRIDDRVLICAGEHQGASGVVTRAQTRHVYAYTVRLDDGASVHAKDEELEAQDAGATPPPPQPRSPH